MGKIVRQHFRVNETAHLAKFYCDLLGMQAFDQEGDGAGDGATKTFGFDANRCCLQFDRKHVTQYQPEANDFYWKIGITLRNLNTAIDFLRSNGVVVSDPHQFRDIGYMSKIADPNGFVIELLQQGFKGNEKPVSDGHPVGAQATLAHITLRVTDLAMAKAFFEDKLSMRLMSLQPVREYGFSLYFYTWSDEVLPNSDLSSVANREWLWRRPYTFIELQHLEMPGATIRKTPPDMAGFDGFSYISDESDKLFFISETKLTELS